MARKIRLIACLILISLVLPYIGKEGCAAQERELLVEVGATRKYTLTKIIDNIDYDGNGDNTTLVMNEDLGKWFMDEHNNTVETVFKEGSTIEFRLMGSLDNLKIQRTINKEIIEEFEEGNVRLPYLFGPIMTPIFLTNFRSLNVIERTVNNKSYWEEIAEKGDFTVEGNYLKGLSVEDYENKPYKTTKFEYRRNWRSGWLSYLYVKASNGTLTIFEYEYSTTEEETTSMGSISFFFAILVCMSLIITLRKKKRY